MDGVRGTNDSSEPSSDVTLYFVGWIVLTSDQRHNVDIYNLAYSILFIDFQTQIQFYNIDNR